MRCPICGTEMNHHADKLVQPASTADERLVDPALGGIIEEAYACPACGAGVVRRAG